MIMLKKRGLFWHTENVHIFSERGKKGQFYIIAAVIIAVLLAGLATTINYAITSPTPTRFYDLSQQYNLESSKVIDYGVYQKYTPEVNISEKIQQFTEQFYDNAVIKDPDIEVIAIYGDANQINVFSATNNEIKIINSAGTELQPAIPASKTVNNIDVQSSLGGQALGTTVVQQYLQKSVYAYRESEVSIKIANVTYNINVMDKPNFYFVIQSKKASGEVNVVSGSR